MKILKKVVTSKNKSSGYKPVWLYSTSSVLFIVAEVKESRGTYRLLSFNKSLGKILEYELVNGFGLANCDFQSNEFVFFSGRFLNKVDEQGNFEISEINNDGFSRVIYFLESNLILYKEINDSFVYRLFSKVTNQVVWELSDSKIINFFLFRLWRSHLVFNDFGLGYSEIKCLNYLTGDPVWSVDVTDWFPFQFDKKTTYKNQVRQLVIYQNLVLVNMNGHVVAFEIETGKEVWRYNLEQSPVIVYQFILDESDGHLWIISAVRKHQKGTLRKINAKTGEILWTAAEPWDTHHPEPDYGDRWWWHFSMNKNFIFLTFESGFMGVMDKKTGEIVEWFKFTKRNGAVNHGHKLLNKTLYQPTDFEFLAIDVSEYFLDGDTMEVNSRDD